MNTLTTLHEIYKATNYFPPRFILCDWKTQEGFEFHNIDEFDKFMDTNKKHEYYILNQTETDDLVLVEYFKLEPSEPMVVAIRHPLMTNAFWKELPDKIIDIAVSDGIYRYSTVSYGKNLKEYVIEFPPEIDPLVTEYCKTLMPKFFKTKSTTTENISLLFTNTNRYIDLDKTNFVTANLNELYPEWKPKTLNIQNLSRKAWDGIRIAVASSKPGLEETE